MQMFQQTFIYQRIEFTRPLLGSKQAPMLWGTVNTTHRYSFKIDKSLMDGRLNIGVEANSPFSKYSRLEQRVVKPEMETIQTNYITARSFGVYISYTFRKGKRVNIERNNTLKQPTNKQV